MTKNVFKFADEPAHPQPRSFWVTRMLITGIIVGLASSYVYLNGYILL